MSPDCYIIINWISCYQAEVNDHLFCWDSADVCFFAVDCQNSLLSNAQLSAMIVQKQNNQHIILLHSHLLNYNLTSFVD